MNIRKKEQRARCASGNGLTARKLRCWAMSQCYTQGTNKRAPTKKMMQKETMVHLAKTNPGPGAFGAWVSLG